LIGLEEPSKVQGMAQNKPIVVDEAVLLQFVTLFWKICSGATTSNRKPLGQM
jgi:hypothetical protein